MKFLMGFSLLLLPLCAFDAPMEFDYSAVEISEMERVVEAPGSYAPFELLNVGIYYLKVEKDFDKAATLCMGGLGRQMIDSKLSDDESDAMALAFFAMIMSEAMQSSSQEEQMVLSESCAAAIRGFEAWDRATPRDYWFNDQLGPAHANDANLVEQVTWQVYRDFSGVVSFDDEARIFRCPESGVSFHLPEEITLNQAPYDKRTYFWKGPNGASLCLYLGGLGTHRSLEDKYDFLRRLYKWDPYLHDFSIEKCRVGDDIEAFHMRFVDEEGVNNQFHFFMEPDIFHEFGLICSEEDEAALLSGLETLLETVRFS